MDDVERRQVDWNCLGCVRDALAIGLISQEEYDTHFDLLAESAREAAPLVTSACPACGVPASSSLGYPDVMHCAACGTYSAYLGRGVWSPYARGVVDALPDSGLSARDVRRMQDQILLDTDIRVASIFTSLTSELKGK